MSNNISSNASLIELLVNINRRLAELEEKLTQLEEALMIKNNSWPQ